MIHVEIQAVRWFDAAAAADVAAAAAGLQDAGVPPARRG